MADADSDGTSPRARRRRSLKPATNGDANGHLDVPKPSRPAGRLADRSPSPLGLIPIHTRFRSFVRPLPLANPPRRTYCPQIHRHEIPRKALHVSVGFLTLSLHANGLRTSQIHPALLTALIPITAIDVLRHRLPALNRLYVSAVGALMRESEVHGYNGVIAYLAGSWAALRFLPPDVAVVAVLLLSWCDTAASTVGRQWGRYTPMVRRGKSVAGSAAALVVGVATAWGFWGWAVGSDAPEANAFQGVLALPASATRLLGWQDGAGTVGGAAALGVLSLWSGVVASVSEAIDVFGLDDNFTIPVLCGVGLWGFLKVFGNA
jgi:diacylglycerol kinase (CTP)